MFTSDTAHGLGVKNEKQHIQSLKEAYGKSKFNKLQIVLGQFKESPPAKKEKRKREKRETFRRACKTNVYKTKHGIITVLKILKHFYRNKLICLHVK